ncbi:MAG: protein phosphatase 2C domain-containing protein [Micrococcales bacterium]|nr:protein phosphatase 2C domain-containing protein [Micrococcales bacterium]
MSTAPRGSGLSLRAGLATDVGRVRQHNEDTGIADRSVFAVCDGMGGHAAGEVASQIVAETLSELADQPELTPAVITRQLAEANDRLLASVARHPEQAGMGTTAAGITVVAGGGGDHWAVFNVGDSRVYRWIAGRLTQVTVDHSEVQELLDAGLITVDEVARHPMRNVITRSLGMDPAPSPDVWVFPPFPGERFVICSDGLTGELRDDQIKAILEACDDPQSAAESLVRAAVEAGGRDNVTVVVVALDSEQPDDDVEGDTSPRGMAASTP